MTSRPSVDWHVPTDEWHSFVNYVKDKHGKKEGYIGCEVEQAMREWINEDDYATIEDQINQLIKASGRNRSNQPYKKRASDTIESKNTTRVSYRVDPRLKSEFSAYVSKTSNDRLGVALARALRECRNGGRSERIENKLDLVLDDAKSLLAKLDNTNKLTAGQERTIVICEKLNEEFTEYQLEEIIRDCVGSSDPTLRNYKRLVLQRLNVVEHPNRIGLYISQEKAQRLGVDLDAHPIEWKPYRALTDKERVEGVRIKLAKFADSNNGKHRIDSKTIVEKIFDSKSSYVKANEILTKAADVDGFATVSHSDKNKLKVSLEQVTDTAILNAVNRDSKTTQSQSTSSHCKTSEMVEGPR